MMNLAFFTDRVNMGLGKMIERKFADEINMVYILDDSSREDIREDVYYFEHNKDAGYEFLEEYGVQTAIIYGWRYKIPQLIQSKVNFYNIHPSLLPKYRGPDPIIFQLLLCETTGGVTIHKVEDKFDSGPIYKQMKFDLASGDTVASVGVKVMKSALTLLAELMMDLLEDCVQTTPQDESKATYYTYKDLNDFTINNKTTYESFFRMIHILSGVYPVRIEYMGGVYRLKAAADERMNQMVKFSLQDSEVYVELEKL